MAANELGIGEPAARQTLEYLATRNLLAIRVTGDVCYQFQPGSPPLHDAALAVAELYRRNPFALLKLVAGTGRRSIRDFADAFRIRRDDDR